MTATTSKKTSSGHWRDLRVVWHLVARPVRGTTHQERLESFYSGQADDYDAFRERLLHGRNELIDRLVFPVAGTWMDIGAGTGRNVLHAGRRTKTLRKITLVDLSPSLLEVAQRNLSDANIDQAEFLLADATRIEQPDESVDLVTFSYSLTMIPDWFAAIDEAYRILKPGGTIGVTDFFVSRKYASKSRRQHGWLNRTFWTLWFAADNVFLSGDHPAMLEHQFEVERFDERAGKVPYLPLIRAPYYIFVGRKRGDA